MTALLIAAVTIAVFIAGLVVICRSRPPRAGDFFGELPSDPDRHRAANLPSLYRGWEGK